MGTRRAFLTGLLATGLVPQATWADAGSPAFLSAAKKPNGNYVLCGLGADGTIRFEVPIAARGHAAAAHPMAPRAVAFARRPGTFAIVLDCVRGTQVAELTAPPGRHFYGHGVFSADGELLFTTENDYDAGAGRVGVWDARNGFVRVGEFSSGGVGPHDIKLMPDGQTLVVANGGIETHPESGRTKLNLPSMRSNLSYLSIDGTVIAKMELGAEHQRNSIRHLALSDAGDVAFAMQWQGDIGVDLPLLGLHRRGTEAAVLFEEASARRLQGYLGSVAFNPKTLEIATTSPRSGVLQVFDANKLAYSAKLPDICGVAANRDGFLVTTGTGTVRSSDLFETTHDVAWDNHLVVI